MSSSLKQLAYQHLRSRLRSGSFPPGQRISAYDSAKELGISQTPVREAIGLLESEGLVHQIPKLGVFVRQLDRREIAELFDLRILLEGFAAARAARRIRPAGPAGLAELERCFGRLRQAARKVCESAKGYKSAAGEELILADAAFHVAIMRAAGNRRVIKLVDDLQFFSRLMTIEFAPVKPSIPAEMRMMVRDHGRLLRAIRQRDPVLARRTMVQQLRLTRKLILDLFDARPGGDGESAPFSPAFLRDMRREEHKVTGQPEPAARRRRRGNKKPISSFQSEAS